MKIKKMWLQMAIPYEGEINNEPSLTVPDQALTPLEILQRFTQGRSVPRSNQLVYTGDHETPDLRSMDLTEIDEMARNTAERIKDGESSINRIKKRRISEAERLKEQELFDKSAKISQPKNDPKNDSNNER